MDTETEIKGIVKELRDIILNNTNFPDDKNIRDAELKNAIIKFKRRNVPKRNKKITIKTARDFIERHRIFNIIKNDIDGISGSGAKLINLEGPDATGKTALAKKIGKMTNSVGIQHQSTALFKMMFGLPKIYKTAVVDYNRNTYVGFLFYIVDNLLGLRQAAEQAKTGKKIIISDSSFLRTFASRLADPTSGSDKLKIDISLYNLIKTNYIKRYADILEEANEAVLIVFIYVSEKARLEQAEKRGHADDYDTNSAYSRLVTKFMREEERMIKRRGINAMSMMMLAEGERHAGKPGKADFYVVRTENLEKDLRKKAKLILENV